MHKGKKSNNVDTFKMDDTVEGQDNLNFTEQDVVHTNEITQNTNSCKGEDNFRKNTPVHMRNTTTTCEICSDVIANGRPAGVRSCPACKKKWAKAR